MATLDYGAVARKYAEQVQAGEIKAILAAKIGEIARAGMS